MIGNAGSDLSLTSSNVFLYMVSFVVACSLKVFIKMFAAGLYLRMTVRIGAKQMFPSFQRWDSEECFDQGKLAIRTYETLDY